MHSYATQIKAEPSMHVVQGLGQVAQQEQLLNKVPPIVPRFTPEVHNMS